MQAFEPERYIGVWHELARIPKPYEKQCCSALAIYSLVKGGIGIQNLCICSSGVIDSISGVATTHLGYRDGFMFHVKFTTPAGALHGTYNICATDYEMFSIVTNEERDCLWILCRNQNVSDEFKQRMIGYCNTFQLRWRELEWRV